MSLTGARIAEASRSQINIVQLCHICHLNRIKFVIYCHLSRFNWMQATHLSESHVSAVIMQNIESDDTALPIQTLERWIMIKPHNITSVRILEHLQRLVQVFGEFEAMPRYSAHRFARHQLFDRLISAEQWNYREIWNGSVFQSVEKRKHKLLCNLIYIGIYWPDLYMAKNDQNWSRPAADSMTKYGIENSLHTRTIWNASADFIRSREILNGPSGVTSRMNLCFVQK